MRAGAFERVNVRVCKLQTASFGTAGTSECCLMEILMLFRRQREKLRTSYLFHYFSLIVIDLYLTAANRPLVGERVHRELTFWRL